MMDAAIKVLVIDDDQTQRLLVKDYLEAAGFVVRQADDGRKGLQMATHTKPDVILLDVLLPLSDGFAICAELKRAPATAEVPVILITGARDSNVIERGLAAGATDFVTKPVDWDFLADRIRLVLDRHTMAPASAARATSIAEAQLRLALEAANQRLSAMASETSAQVRAAEAAAEARFQAAAAEQEKEWERRLRRALQAAKAEAERREVEIRRTAEDHLRRQTACAEARHHSLHNEAVRRTDEIWPVVAVSMSQQIESLARTQAAIAEAWSALDQAAASDHVRALLGQAHLTVSELQHTSEQLALFAQLNTTAHAPHDTVVALEALFDNLAHEIADFAAERGVVIVHRCERPIVVSADVEWLKLALLSLLDNGVKFSMPGGSVQLLARMDDKGGIILQVMDFGVGIAPALLDRLRTSLDRPSQMIQPGASMLGYGVPVAMAIARRHGGSLRLDSALGRGTVATLMLPAERRLDDGAVPLRAAG